MHFWQTSRKYSNICSSWQSTVSEYTLDHCHLSPEGPRNSWLVIACINTLFCNEDFAKQTSVTKLLKLGGFFLRKYLSNELTVLSGVPIEDIASNSKSFSDTEIFPVLGLSWQPLWNAFDFNMEGIEITPKLTMCIVKIFRPFGLAWPCSYDG